MYAVRDDMTRQWAARHDHRTSFKAFTLTAVTWALSLSVSIYFTVCQANNAGFTPVWEQNYLHATALTMDSIAGSLVWIALFLLQLFCLTHAILSVAPEFMDTIVDITLHVVMFNTLHLMSVLLFAWSCLWWMEVVLVLNLTNMTALYFRCRRSPWLIRSSMASGPLAWTFFAVLWNGATLLSQTVVADRPAGSSFLWWIFCFGVAFASTCKDETICFFLSALVTSVGLHHTKKSAESQQWITCVAIAAVLYVVAFVIFLSRVQAYELRKRAVAADVATDVEAIGLREQNGRPNLIPVTA